jgi:ATP-dependent HslUV protease subunit HslV
MSFLSASIRRFCSAPKSHSTTILCVRKGDKVVLMGDGQVTLGSMVIKPNVRKLRRFDENIIGGFAGSTADCLSLVDVLEAKLHEHPGQLLRASVSLAKEWRQAKFLRQLQASLIVADRTTTLQITGNGDVIESVDGVLSIGSGSPYARAAALALMDTDMSAEEIAKKAMTIAADICVYTNHNFVTEIIPALVSK